MGDKMKPPALTELTFFWMDRRITIDGEKAQRKIKPKKSSMWREGTILSRVAWEDPTKKDDA